MKGRVRFYRLLLTLLSVILIRLSFTDGPLSLLAWVCFIPFGLALNGAGKAEGFFIGFLMAFLSWLGSVYWLATGLVLYMSLSRTLSWVGTLLYCAYASIPYTLFGLLCGMFQGAEKPLS